MVETIRSSTLRARKPHVCDYCGHVIHRGDRYVRASNKFDGRVYTWKMHEYCGRLSATLWRYVDPDDGGMDTYTFRDAVTTVMSELYCPAHCTRWDADCGCAAGNDMKNCLMRFGEFMRTHELRNVAGPDGIRAWRIVDKAGKA